MTPTDPLTQMDRSPVPGLPVGLPVRPAEDIVGEIDQAHQNAMAGLSPEAQQAAHGAGLAPVAATAPATTAPAVAPTMPAPPPQGLPRPTATATPAQDRYQASAQSGSGISHLPLAGRIPLTILDAIGQGIRPLAGIERAIPGTAGYHQAQLGQQEKAATEEGLAQEAQAREGLQNAQGAEAEANAAKAAKGPAAKFTPVPTAGGIVPFNESTGEAGAAVGQPPEKSPNVHVLPDGTVIAITTGEKGEPKSEVVYKGDPKVETDAIERVGADGKPHTVLVNRGTGEDIKDLGEKYVAPRPANTKTVTLDVGGEPHEVMIGEDGNIVKDLGKKGQEPKEPKDNGQNFVDPASGRMVRVQPGGVVPKDAVTATQSGSEVVDTKKDAAKKDAANDAAKAALSYGDDYVKGGKFTGAGDEALMEKYFELAKPSSGFRMTQPQIDMLMHGRSWMESAEGVAYHAQTGTWFPPKQRTELVDTMKALGKSKGIGGAEASGTATVHTKADYDKLPSGTSYIDSADGKTYKKK